MNISGLCKRTSLCVLVCVALVAASLGWNSLLPWPWAETSSRDCLFSFKQNWLRSPWDETAPVSAPFTYNLLTINQMLI